MDLEELDNLLNDNPKDKFDERIIKGPFPFPGSKRRSLSNILPLLPYRDIWVDVFGGTGVVTLNRQKSKKLDVFNDRWSGITDFFRCVRDHDSMKEMIRRLELMPRSKEEFYYCRYNWDINDPIERATRWYYLMCNSFGGVARNWGRGTSMKGPSQHNKLKWLPAIQSRMTECQIDNDTWQRVFDAYDSPSTIFYCDPPYYDAHVGAYKHNLLPNEHEVLLAAIFDLHGFVAVSSYRNKLYDAYPWDEVHEWEVMSTLEPKVSTASNHRLGSQERNTYRTEVLYIKEVR